ncbi:MAG: sigma-70 family RNA polymerase sigma factor [Phycisphaerales bacterium]|nr:MAG: sigma-70 family RNA polymerase sigma factor [Phycisphaerales bacterium]
MYGAADIDDEIVRLAAEGSRPELGRIMEALEPQLHLMVSARLSPTPAQFHAAEDIKQQVLLAVTTGVGGLRNRTVSGLKAYVSGIVMRTVAEFLRQRGKRGAAPKGAGSLDSVIAGLTHAGPLWQFLSASITSPPTAAGRAEQLGQLMSELGRLKPEYRKAITLAFCDQLPTSEIARQMDLSPRAASMLLLRAVRALRRNMEILSRIEKANAVAT